MVNKIAMHDLLLMAEKFLNQGLFREAHNILNPLVGEGVPEALFLASTFSVSETESEQEFEARSISMLQLASNQGYAPAIYALANCYETGDMVDANPTYSAQLYKAAAEKGVVGAKFRHGLNLIHGSNGIEEDRAVGLLNIRAAAEAGVIPAKEYLAQEGLI